MNGLSQPKDDKMTDKKLTIRANAFGKVETLKVLVSDGTVRVWDSVAGYYTACHSLKPSAIKRILAA